MPTTDSPKETKVQVTRDASGDLAVIMTGEWTLADAQPTFAEVERGLDAALGVRRILLDGARVGQWDSGLLVFVSRVESLAKDRGIVIEATNLPPGVDDILQLARTGVTGEGRAAAARTPFVQSVGKAAQSAWDGARDFMEFTGEFSQSLWRFVTGKAHFRMRELFVHIEDAGPGSLPIVTLIMFLIGLILGFIGALQLEQFGAQLYVANLVGLGMTREMAAMMTAIIMTGRTGAAYAAELGTMTVNEEIDALRTTGISPMDFLVLPRMLALAIMMPLLVLYADFVGILGGLVVGTTVLDIPFAQYFEQTKAAISPEDFASGLVKAAVYGALVATAGCMRGMQSGRDAAAVGSAVTSAVVTGIVFVIVASAIMTILFRTMGW